jgi:hypothetical protein
MKTKLLEEWKSARETNIGRTPFPVTLFPPQIPHYLTWDGTWDALARLKFLRIVCIS